MNRTSATASPAAAKAREFLAGVIDSQRSSRAPLLPSLDELASQAGVSRMTMWQALQRAREAGVITAGRGRPMTIAGLEAPSAAHPSAAGRKPGRQTRRGALSRDLTDAIVEGRYLPGQMLPPIKELCRTYGVCYRTMTASLEELRRNRLIQARGRRFMPAVTTLRHAYKPYVVLVGFGAHGRLGLMTPRAHDQIRAVEVECAGLGLGLVILTVDLLGPRSLAPRSWTAVLERVRRFPPLGVLLWTVSMWDEPIRRALDFARRLDVPVACLDEGNPVPLRARQRPGMRIKPFSAAATQRAGEDVGRYLLGLGHRRIAFVAVSRSAHALARCHGVSDALASAGYPDAVVAHMLPDVGAGEARSAGASEVLGKVMSHGMWVAGQTEDLVRLRSMVAKTLAAGEFTAWVCDRDTTAVECVDFLHERGLDIPGRISVVGFDDSVEALVYGLTSYNFNGVGVARAMLAYVLSPQPVDGVTEVPGMVVERRTSGPARRPVPTSASHAG